MAVKDRASRTSLGSQTMRGLVWSFSGVGMQAILQFVVLMVLARLIEPRAFGLLSAALIAVQFSDLFVQLGIGPALVQRKNITDAHIRTGLTFSLILGALFSVMFWNLAPVLASFLKIEQGLPSILRVIGLIFPVQAVSVVSQSLLERDLHFRTISLTEVVCYFVGYGLVGILLAWSGYGVWALVGAVFVQSVLKGIILSIASPHSWKFQLNFTALHELLFFGGGYTVARIANFLALQGDNIVVSRALGPQALGLYGRAYQLMIVPATLIGQVLDRVMFPVMSKVREDRAQIGQIYYRCFALMALIVLPLSAVVCVFAEEIVLVLLGEQWRSIVMPLRIFGIGMFVRTSYKMSDSLVRAEGKVYQRAQRQIVYAILVFLGSWIGARWGITGVAIGVLLAITANFLLMLQLSLSLLKIKWATILTAHVPGLCLSVVVLAVSIPVRFLASSSDLPSIVVLGIGGVATIGVCLLTILVYPKVLSEVGIDQMCNILVRTYPGLGRWVGKVKCISSN